MANFILDQTGQEIQDILDIVGNNQATQGQVLTADGSGGASWANASGGGSLYRHTIRITGGVSCNPTINIINKSSTSFTASTLLQYLIDNGYNSSSKIYPSNGFAQEPSSSLIVKNHLRIAIGVYANTSTNNIMILYRDITYVINNNNIEISIESDSGNYVSVGTDLVNEL